MQTQKSTNRTEEIRLWHHDHHQHTTSVLAFFAAEGSIIRNMMYPKQQRALLPGDPSAFKRRRLSLSSLSDGNKSAVLTLLSFKGGVPDTCNLMTSPGQHTSGYQRHSPPIHTINARNQQRGGGGQSFSSTSTNCSSVTYSGSVVEEAEGTKTEVLGENGGIRLIPPPVREPRSTGTSPPRSLLNMAMAQPSILPQVQTESRTDHPRASQRSAAQLPEGRPLPPPPKLPPPPPPPSTAPHHNHSAHHSTK